MKRPSTTSDHLEWESLVGRALLRFGDIEYVSVRCLDVIPGERLFASTSGLEFSRRVDILLEILNNRKELTPPLSKLRDAFKRAKELAKKRNLIAHNPLMLSLYVNHETQESAATYRIDSARSAKHSITLDELKEFSAEVDDLAATIWLEFGNVAGDDGQMWKEFTYIPES
jgi:hypothetical protein